MAVEGLEDAIALVESVLAPKKATYNVQPLLSSPATPPAIIILPSNDTSVKYLESQGGGEKYLLRAIVMHEFTEMYSAQVALLTEMNSNVPGTTANLLKYGAPYDITLREARDYGRGEAGELSGTPFIGVVMHLEVEGSC